MTFKSVIVLVTILSAIGVALADGECAQLAGGAPCKDGFCCSKSGYCGTAAAWCDADHCQSQCWGPTPPSPPSTPSPPPPPVTPSPPPPPAVPTPPAPPSSISSLIDSDLFDELLKHRNDGGCEHPGFYTYAAFITAANSFPEFGTVGDTETRKREIAAFLAQTSHETTGGWDDAPDGRYTWGYCFVTEQTDRSEHCSASVEWPCVFGKYYFGRGPVQLTHNYNYGPAGRDIGYNLLSEPEALENDAVLSFKSALWFWMTPQAPKPSCHDAITGQWTPTDRDVAGKRLPGYGVLTNIINGGLECNKGPQVSREQEDRIGFYKKYCSDFGISVGDNVDCYYQLPFNVGVGLVDDM